MKWYELDEPANLITTETRALARAALYYFGTNLTVDPAGFAILHNAAPLCLPADRHMARQ